LETQAETFSAEAFAPAHTAVAGHRLPITEALSLRLRDVDMDNMLLTLVGKGRKQRIIPFSFVMRKLLHRFITDFERKPEYLLFATRDNTAVRRMTVLRGVKILCTQLGFRCSTENLARLPAHIRGQLPSPGRKCVPSAKMRWVTVLSKLRADTRT
jgi:integrase